MLYVPPQTVTETVCTVIYTWNYHSRKGTLLTYLKKTQYLFYAPLCDILVREWAMTDRSFVDV